MPVATIARAVLLFAVTNVDDLVVLSLLLHRAGRRRSDRRQVVLGQFLGMAGIIALSLAGAAGAQLLPDGWLAWLGLVPLALGVRAAIALVRRRGTAEDDRDEPLRDGLGRHAVAVVASVTLANGGDNVAVYVSVFASSTAAATALTVATFAALVGVWCAAADWISTRPAVERSLDRWGEIVLPVVLVALGLAILVEGGALG